jgi:hypothetical protein
MFPEFSSNFNSRIPISLLSTNDSKSFLNVKRPLTFLFFSFSQVPLFEMKSSTIITLAFSCLSFVCSDPTDESSIMSSNEVQEGDDSLNSLSSDNAEEEDAEVGEDEEDANEDFTWEEMAVRTSESCRDVLIIFRTCAVAAISATTNLNRAAELIPALRDCMCAEKETGIECKEVLVQAGTIQEDDLV